MTSFRLDPGAREAEAQAYDDYKQALDRPWEPQAIRDSLYKDWQRRIADRDLAERRLEATRTALQVHYFDIESKERDIVEAEKDLALVQQNEVARKVDPSYERAIEDAERTLVEVEDALADARLYAPWAGLVTEIHVNVGSTVDPGATIVTLRAYPETVLVGRVESIVPRQEVAADEAHFAAHIRLDETDLGLLPGMTGRVEVIANEP